MLRLHVFADPLSCEIALAEVLVQRLKHALQIQPTALAMLAGGNTPRALYQRLRKDFTQPGVWLTPTDERWVEPDSAQSNSHLLATLFDGAQQISPYQHADPLHSAVLWAKQLRAHIPPAIGLLGMGEDGHIASLFPHMPGLGQAMQLDAAPGTLLAQAPSVPCQRLSVNLAMLLSCQWLGLLAYGGEKRALLEAALQAGADLSLPINALAAQRQRAVEVFWAP